MRKLLSIIVSVLMLSSGLAMAMPEGEKKDGQKTEQNTEKKEEKKAEKKEEKNANDPPRRTKPINFVYEFAWPWIMR